MVVEWHGTQGIMDRPIATRKLGKVYDVSHETIRRWRSEGAPVEDPDALHEFLAGRSFCALAQRVEAASERRRFRTLIALLRYAEADAIAL